MRPRPWRLLVVAAAIGGLALRVWVAASEAGSLNSDEAVVGLMAKQILDGDAQAFFWGQHYAGTLEPALVAAVRFLTGTHVLPLKLVPIGLSALATVLVWRVGRRLVAEREAQAAALLFWLGPAAYVWLATRELGFYWASLGLGLAFVLAALRLVDRPSPGGWVVLGLVAGLGWWTSPMSLYVLVPVGGWLVVHERRRLQYAWLAAPAAVAGALPWLWHNIGHGWPSLDQPPQGEDVSVVVGAGRLAWRATPIVLGLRRVRSESWLHPVMAVLFVAVVVAIAVGLAVCVRDRRRPPMVLLLVLAAFPVIYVVFPGRWWAGDARYALFAWPFLALLGTWLLRTPIRMVTAVGAVAALAAIGVQDIGVARPPVHLGDDIRSLQAAGVDRAWADYWLAYRITFESDERVVVTPTRNVRHRPYADAVDADPTPAILFLAADRRLAGFRAAVDASGAEHTETATPNLVVFAFADRAALDRVPRDAWP